MNRPLWVVLTGVSLCLLWLFFAGAARGGSVRGLFYTGEYSAIPPVLAAENIPVIRGERGYDGQFYHYVAHDPWLQHGMAEFVDNPRLRWRRILLPGLAFVSVGGGSDLDYAYIGWQLLFTALGIYWLGALSQFWGRDVRYGLLFLLIPSVLVSLDRMTIDLPLAALVIGAVYYGLEGKTYPLLFVLTLAPLVRETGALIIIGMTATQVLQRRIRIAVLASLTILPAIGWWTYVRLHTANDQTPWLAHWPFAGLIERTLVGVNIPRNGWWLTVAGAAERLTLTGLWLALLICCYWVFRRRAGLLEICAMTYAVFAATLGKADIWADTYAAARTMTPLLLLIALVGLRDRQRWLLAPMLCALPRIALQFEVSLKGLLHAF